MSDTERHLLLSAEDMMDIYEQLALVLQVQAEQCETEAQVYLDAVKDEPESMYSEARNRFAHFKACKAVIFFQEAQGMAEKGQAFAQSERSNDRMKRTIRALSASVTRLERLVLAIAAHGEEKEAS